MIELVSEKVFSRLLRLFCAVAVRDESGASKNTDAALQVNDNGTSGAVPYAGRTKRLRFDGVDMQKFPIALEQNMQIVLRHGAAVPFQLTQVVP